MPTSYILGVVLPGLYNYAVAAYDTVRLHSGPVSKIDYQTIFHEILHR